MRRERFSGTVKPNSLTSCLQGWRAEYGFILLLALIAISTSENNEQQYSPRRLSYLEEVADTPGDKSKTTTILHRKSRRTTKRHVTQIRIWKHRCERRPSGFWSAQLPIIFYCIPVSFVSNTTEDNSMNNTNSSKRKKTFFSNRTDDFTTYRTPRNLDRALMDASLQFDVPVDVTDLRLWFQRIMSVEDKAFIGLDRLKLLGLQHNEISYLSRDAFAGLIVLERLDLSHNRLIAIHNQVFRHLRNLTTLNLRFNEITYIGNSMFCGLDHISVLDLSYNMITDIDEYALQHFRSSYAFTVDVSHNSLKTPKAEWLMLGSDSISNRSCTEERPSRIQNKLNGTGPSTIPLFDKNISGMEIVIKRTDNPELGETNTVSTYSLPPVRLFRASNNPWSCKCDSKMRVIEFIRLYQSVLSTQLNGAVKVEDALSLFRNPNINTAKDINFVSKVTNPKAYASWYFNIPCSDEEFQGIDLGRLTRLNSGKIEKTCCQPLSESSFGNEVISNDEALSNSCREDNETETSNLTDNHVTIIGIVIVFSTPILLTLCPDCNRTVAPSSRSNVVTSSGKFGAVSLNANNNRGQWIDRRSGRKTFENERFCLVVQEHKRDQRRFLESETV